MYSIKYLCVENILFWELHIKILKNICSELYTEVKNIKTEEPNKQDKLDKLNNSDKLDILDKPIKENKSNVGERRYSTGIIRKSNIIKSGSEYRYGDGNQAFPYINETGDTMNNNNHFSNINSIIRSDNYENPTYFDTLMMENSYNINIFSLNSNSSNIYESDSTGLSTSKSQSIEVKLNIETSDIKKIVFDQIFKELVIPEETWDVMLKRMSNFNENYMEQYKKMYDIYINPKGIVPMKLKGNSVKNIALKVNKSEYSYDMYFPILEDVATLIYDHVYLNLDI
ncbi:hypothetical protein BCR32DRAFT_244288 [Anaeromyces robustus]|uniref:Uncharacterized protein n=1 Tax=Anaeromyces robustus TaxID=1754192 RepID=A0A1Y1XA03_9FUNG|nr:hypothetical protein BCR32DRAFT_244288 [Anaeromyces robustus]|eukprot:ORX82256.1 hypothetical protein BCR32DRAFT_244288 [Anaeromyces robustus]